MSRDTSVTYIHMHSSRHADLFEEFCRPPSSFAGSSASSLTNPQNNPGAAGNTNGTSASTDPGQAQLPGYFLPFEEIVLPPHLMPLNPEDEDDVVPDMHAAYGINRALGQGRSNGAGNGAGTNGAAGGEMSGAGAQREPAWRDLGLESLLDGGLANGNAGTSTAGFGGLNSSARTTTAARREGRRTGVLLLR